MFSRTFQQEQEEMNSKNYRPRDTLSEKVKALSVAKEGGKEKREEEEEGEGISLMKSLVCCQSSQILHCIVSGVDNPYLLLVVFMDTN